MTGWVWTLDEAREMIHEQVEKHLDEYLQDASYWLAYYLALDAVRCTGCAEDGCRQLAQEEAQKWKN